MQNYVVNRNYRHGSLPDSKTQDDTTCKTGMGLQAATGHAFFGADRETLA
jgi:hypothetical protein